MTKEQTTENDNKTTDPKDLKTALEDALDLI